MQEKLSFYWLLIPVNQFIFDEQKYAAELFYWYNGI